MLEKEPFCVLQMITHRPDLYGYPMTSLACFHEYAISYFLKIFLILFRWCEDPLGIAPFIIHLFSLYLLHK